MLSSFSLTFAKLISASLRSLVAETSLPCNADTSSVLDPIYFCFLSISALSFSICSARVLISLSREIRLTASLLLLPPVSEPCGLTISPSSVTILNANLVFCASLTAMSRSSTTTVAPRRFDITGAIFLSKLMSSLATPKQPSIDKYFLSSCEMFLGFIDVIGINVARPN